MIYKNDPDLPTPYVLTADIYRLTATPLFVCSAINLIKLKIDSLMNLLSSEN